MGRKRYSPEQIIGMLREAEVAMAQGQTVGQVLSHWTWLPPLRKQLAKTGGEFFNAGK